MGFKPGGEVRNKRTDELRPGDTVLVPGRCHGPIRRTVKRIGTTAYLNYLNQPIRTVFYKEQDELWSDGNSACDSTLWPVEDVTEDA